MEQPHLAAASWLEDALENNTRQPRRPHATYAFQRKLAAPAQPQPSATRLLYLGYAGGRCPLSSNYLGLWSGDAGSANQTPAKPGSDLAEGNGAAGQQTLDYLRDGDIRRMKGNVCPWG